MSLAWRQPVHTVSTYSVDKISVQQLPVLILWIR